MDEGATVPPPELVEREWLDRRIDGALAEGPGEQAGLFGPGSMMWQVGRETITFLGAGRAALLQLAHPWVANAIDQHSSTAADPIGRFRRTFTQVFSLVYGDAARVRRSARAVHAIHGRIHGALNEASGAYAGGSAYYANEPEALLWVHATLWDTALRMYELMHPPLDAVARERYYQESKRFAACFGVPERLIPVDWAAFQEYFDGMLASDRIHVADTGRRMGRMLFELDVPLAGRALHVQEELTADFMPEKLREGFLLPAAGPALARRNARRLRWIRRLYPLMPAALRHVPPYLEAQRRLRGRGSSLTTRALTRLWLGRDRLVAD